MAESFINEGIDYIINAALRGGTADSTFFIGLFTSQSASTVPARTATGGASPSGITEMTASSGTYARIAVTFAVPVDDTSGRKTTAAEVTFTSFVSAAAANGFFIASNSASGAGDTLLFAANFDSGVARSLATVSDQLKITPTAVFNA